MNLESFKNKVLQTLAQIGIDVKSKANDSEVVKITIPEDHNPILTFDKSKYNGTAITQSTAINYSLAASGHVDGTVIRHKITSDGVNPITFPAEWNVFGKPSDDIFPAGLQIIYFSYIGGDVDVVIPTYTEESTTDPDPDPTDPTLPSPPENVAASEITEDSALITWNTVLEGDTEAPSVPQNVTVDNITETDARVSWDSSTDN